ncbi:MAG: hypothetical protein P8016_07355, partial [Sedimentisphaerales bacterium]
MRNEAEQNITDKKLSWRKYKLAAVFMSLLITAALVSIYFTQEQKPDPASERVLRQAAAVQLKNQTHIDKDPNDLTDEDF